MFYPSRYSNERALIAFDIPCTSSEQTYSIGIILINTRWHSSSYRYSPFANQDQDHHYYTEPFGWKIAHIYDNFPIFNFNFIYNLGIHVIRDYLGKVIVLSQTFNCL